MGVLADIATYLAAQGQGIYDTSGNTSSIFTHWMPDLPAAALSVELYGSAMVGAFLFDDTLPMSESPRLKLTARDTSPDAAFTRCYAAWKALIGLSDVALGGVHYFSVRSVNGPAWNGTQDSNSGTLYLYGANVQAQRVIG